MATDSIEPRRKNEIIDDLLNWSSDSDLLTLEQHITEEIGKLDKKTKKSRSFKEQYQERSRELVSTVIDRLEDSQELLYKWRQQQKNDENYTITERDKIAIADVLEFVVNPFSRFANSASDTLGAFSATHHVDKIEKVKSTAMKTSNTLNHNITAYDKLQNLLVELCDSVDYIIPQNVRSGKARHDWELG